MEAAAIVLPSLLVSLCFSSLPTADEREGEPRRNYKVEDFLWSGSGDGSVVPSQVCGESCLTSTPTLPTPAPPPPEPDHRYWLVTVLKTSSPPDLGLLELALARLYRTAFFRQQEKHLKLRGGSGVGVRERVSVHVQRVGQEGDLLEVVYSVRVAGRSVDALVAAHDMRLVSETEATRLLGHPVLTKAEPYLKPAETLEAPGERNTYLLLGASICAFILLVVLIILFSLGVQKNKKKVQKATTYTETQKREITRANTSSEDENSMEKGGERKPHRAPSPHSYLSMPSVKAFPRGAMMPRPLEEVLEPQLVRQASDTPDPGVLGPIVWDLHRHRTTRQEWGEPGRVRQRFQDLLEDAFTLFGSPPPSPTTPATLLVVDGEERRVRPKTSEGRRGAWEGARPLSAGPFHRPALEPAYLRTDASLPHTHAALPLIEAIKRELDKFPSKPIPTSHRSPSDVL